MMMKKILSLLTAALLCLLLVLPAFAAEAVTGPDAIPAERQKPLLVDDADLLTVDQELELLTKLTKYTEELKCDFAVVTVPSLNGKDIRDFADDYYDYNGYGYGKKDDGLLVVLCVPEGKMWATTYGVAKKITTEEIENSMKKEIASLKSGDYNKSINSTVDELHDIVYSKRHVAPKWIVIDLVIGFVVAFIIMKIVTGNLKSVRKQVNANEYVVPGSLVLDQSYDRFLYSNVTRVAKETSSGSSGNGSHTSSSGRSHGGGGISF